MCCIASIAMQTHTCTSYHQIDTYEKQKYSIYIFQGYLKYEILLMYYHGLINSIDNRAKCRHLKKLTCKWTLRQVLIWWRPTFCIAFYESYLSTAAIVPEFIYIFSFDSELKAVLVYQTNRGAENTVYKEYSRQTEPTDSQAHQHSRSR